MFQAALLVALSDGKPQAEEIRKINDLLKLHPAFAQLQDPKGLLVETWKELKADGMDACVERVAAAITAREDRELAFRVCAQVMQADGTSQGEEAMVLGELQERFGFTPDDVKRLMRA
jgi:tellurite resistance protein